MLSSSAFLLHVHVPVRSVLVTNNVMEINQKIPTYSMIVFPGCRISCSDNDQNLDHNTNHQFLWVPTMLYCVAVHELLL